MNLSFISCMLILCVQACQGYGSNRRAPRQRVPRSVGMDTSIDATHSIDVEGATDDLGIITIIEDVDASTILDPDENAVTESSSGTVLDGMDTSMDTSVGTSMGASMGTSMGTTQSIDVEAETDDSEMITIIEVDASTILDPDENAVTQSSSGAVVDATLNVISIKEGIKRAPVAAVDRFIAKEADFTRAAVTNAGNVFSTASRKISNAPAAIAARIEAHVDAIERFIANGADAKDAKVDATGNAKAATVAGAGNVVSKVSRRISNAPTAIAAGIDVKADAVDRFIVKGAGLTRATVDAAGNVISTVAQKVFSAPKVIAAGIEAKVEAVHRFIDELDARMRPIDSIDVIEEVVL